MIRNKRHDLGNGNKLFIVKIVNEKEFTQKKWTEKIYRLSRITL